MRRPVVFPEPVSDVNGKGLILGLILFALPASEAFSPALGYPPLIAIPSQHQPLVVTRKRNSDQSLKSRRERLFFFHKSQKLGHHLPELRGLFRGRSCEASAIQTKWRFGRSGT